MRSRYRVCRNERDERARVVSQRAGENAKFWPKFVFRPVGASERRFGRYIVLPRQHDEPYDHVEGIAEAEREFEPDDPTSTKDRNELLTAPALVKLLIYVDDQIDEESSRRERDQKVDHDLWEGMQRDVNKSGRTTDTIRGKITIPRCKGVSSYG